MTIFRMMNWQRLRGFCLLLSFLFLALLPSSCGDSEEVSLSNGSDETASAGLTINWHETTAAQDAAPIRAAVLDCQAAGVEYVVCEVYDAAGNWLATGGPWPCEVGSGRVESIPVGQDRIFVALAEDDLGNILYHGETTGVVIQAGQITPSVVIEAYLFVPTLSAPLNDTQDVDPSDVSLEWEPVENADEYLVQVATDADFEDIVISETTPATVHAPPTLEPSTEYFWKICAVDMQTNAGADSEVRRFVTSDATGSITVTLSPSEAISAGARWRVDGGTWHASGYTQSDLSVGDHTVDFNEIDGWARPGNQIVTITEDETVAVSGTYTQETGSLTVTLSPSEAVSAGARWRVDGGAWRTSGYTQTGLSVGSHTVEFSEIDNWNEPGNQTVAIVSNQTATASGSYTCIAPSTPNSIDYPSSDDDGSFTVSWSGASGATSYTLQRATNPSFTRATTLYEGSSASFTQRGLGTGTYYYRVRAENSCGSSGWRTGQALFVCITPSTPDNIDYPDSDCDYSFTVSWSGVSGATSYTLQRATNTSFTGATTLYEGSSTSYVQLRLGTGTYYYRVRAENSCGNSGWRTGGAISVSTTPSAPGSIDYPDSDDDGSFRVSWSSISGASYHLQRATNYYFSGATTVYTGSSTSFNETGLDEGTYYYRVRAENDCGNSDWREGGPITVDPPIDVTGTWNLSFDWGCDGDPAATTWNIYSDYTFLSGDTGTGTWRLDGSQITLTYDDTGAVYTGTVDGSQMSGDMSWDQYDGCWSASRAGSILSFEVGVDSGESSAQVSGSPLSR